MTIKFYIDTSIWIDLIQDRKGYSGEPLGDYALKLFALIEAKNHTLIISDLLLRELESAYSIEEINGMFLPFNVVEKVLATKEQRDEAKKIAEERDLPPGDVLHAIIARDNGLVLITRDKHFRELEDIAGHFKPEDIIAS